jgi:hypothetical protein
MPSQDEYANFSVLAFTTSVHLAKFLRTPGKKGGGGWRGGSCVVCQVVLRRFLYFITFEHIFSLFSFFRVLTA